MKKKLIIQTICIWILFAICSCAKPVPTTEEDILNRTDEVEALDFLNTLSFDTLRDKDNSKDAYSASFRRELTLSEYDEDGADIFIISASQAVRYKKHIYDVWEKSWDEVSIVTASGDARSVPLKLADRFNCIGEVVGSDQYIASKYECDDKLNKITHSFFNVDCNWQEITPIELPDMSNYEDALVFEIKKDVKDYYHLVIEDAEIGDDYICDTGRWHYIILSPTGELVWEYQDYDYSCPKLMSMYDGSVGYLLTTAQCDSKGVEKNEYRFFDIEQQKQQVLFDYDEDYSTHYLYYTMFDEDTILYVNTDGIYLKEKDAKSAKPIYLWINHGLKVSWVCDVKIKQDGTFSIICNVGSEKMYMEMTPTPEDVEIQTLTLAVSDEMKPVYAKAVSEFNKSFPTCQLELKDDYDETALLTELISGQGPVLIDTHITGFEEQKKLWLPLDSALVSIGVSDDLVEAAKDIGKIDGKIYGVVTDFYLQTVVIDNHEIHDWNYKIFLEELYKQKDMLAVMNSVETDVRWNFFASFLFQNADDNYFLSPKKGVSFDSSEFNAILDLIDQYCVTTEPVKPGGLLPEGNVFCNELVISKPEQMGLYRKVYGDDINYIGYPTSDGACHFVISKPPLTIRKNASQEEIAFAMAFIQILLSQESQQEMVSEANYSLSVRKDVLAKQVDDVNADTWVYAPGLGEGKIGVNWDRQLDGEKFYEILSRAKIRKYASKELTNILTDEFQAYFSGDITREMLIEHLDNRVGLYYSERSR